MEGMPTTATAADLDHTITLTPDPGDYLTAAYPPWRNVDWAAHEHQVMLRNGVINYVDDTHNDERD